MEGAMVDVRAIVAVLAVAGGWAAMPAVAQTLPNSDWLAGGTMRGPAPAAPRGEPAAVTRPVAKPDPRQRLDAGAWVCATEADLQRHAAAIAARLDGQEAPEPPGCTLVRRVTPVAVVERHGLGVTEVRLPGPPERQAWTDAVVREASPAAKY
jgi:hypothetical protein